MGGLHAKKAVALMDKAAIAMKFIAFWGVRA
jgi:hypothetical protein